MIVFFAGPVYGHIKKFYDDVLNLENVLGIKADWILQTGDFGIYLDKTLMHRNLIKNNAGTDFLDMYPKQIEVPRPTLIISGRHDDHIWMDRRAARNSMEFLPNLHWLINGNKTYIGNHKIQLSVAGLGKVYSPTVYKKIRNPKPWTYTRSEIDSTCSKGPLDILMTYEAPYGESVNNWPSEAQGINQICFATRPKILIHGKSSQFHEYITKQTNTSALGIPTSMIRPYELVGRRFSSIV